MSLRRLNPGFIVSAGLLIALCAPAAGAADRKVDLSKLPPPAAKHDVTYQKDIKPIFEKSCFKCHGPEKQKAKLRLDSLQAALKGAEEGRVVVPGDSAKSILVHNISQIGDEEHWMPPVDNKDKIPPLTKEQVGIIRAWIDQGVK